MNENSDSDLGFRFPTSQETNIPNLPCSSSHAVNYDLNSRKKQPKLIKMDGGRQFPTCSRRKSTKKPDPTAPKITRPCSECGKKFWSWKALFGHMRCHPERQWRGINPPPNHHRSAVSPIKQTDNTDETFLMTKEDHETAASLLMLANGSAFTESQWGRNDKPTDDFGANLGSNSGFEPSRCNKVLGSIEASERHRVTHKKLKDCFASTTRSEVDDSKVMMVLGHKCSICLRVFSSGQALGGHMRCHWDKRDDTSSLNQGLNPLTTREEYCSSLDLNSVASIEDDPSS